MATPGLEPRPPAPRLLATALLHPLAPALLPSEYKRSLLPDRPRSSGFSISLPDGELTSHHSYPHRPPASHGSLCPVGPPPAWHLLLQSDFQKGHALVPLSLHHSPMTPLPPDLPEPLQTKPPGRPLRPRDCPSLEKSSTFLNECLPPLVLLPSQERNRVSATLLSSSRLLLSQYWVELVYTALALPSFRNNLTRKLISNSDAKSRNYKESSPVKILICLFLLYIFR